MPQTATFIDKHGIFNSRERYLRNILRWKKFERLANDAKNLQQKSYTL